MSRPNPTVKKLDDLSEEIPIDIAPPQDRNQMIDKIVDTAFGKISSIRNPNIGSLVIGFPGPLAEDAELAIPEEDLSLLLPGDQVQNLEYFIGKHWKAVTTRDEVASQVEDLLAKNLFPFLLIDALQQDKLRGFEMNTSITFGLPPFKVQEGDKYAFLINEESIKHHLDPLFIASRRGGDDKYKGGFSLNKDLPLSDFIFVDAFTGTVEALASPIRVNAFAETDPQLSPISMANQVREMFNAMDLPKISNNLPGANDGFLASLQPGKVASPRRRAVIGGTSHETAALGWLSPRNNIIELATKEHFDSIETLKNSLSEKLLRGYNTPCEFHDSVLEVDSSNYAHREATFFVGGWFSVKVFKKRITFGFNLNDPNTNRIDVYLKGVKD